MSTYPTEVLFRLREPGDPIPPSWSVVLTEKLSRFGGLPKEHSTDPLTPEQAEALGWPLDRVIPWINAEAVADRDRARAELAGLRHELDEVRTQRDEAMAAAADLPAVRAQLAEALASGAALAAAMAAAEPPKPTVDASPAEPGPEVAPAGAV